MIVTIVCGLMMMAGLFLMLLSGVGFIQDKRFFGTAPKAVLMQSYQLTVVISGVTPKRYCAR